MGAKSQNKYILSRRKRGEVIEEAIDYFVSDDTGEEEFIKRFNKIAQKYKKYVNRIKEE